MIFSHCELYQKMSVFAIGHCVILYEKQIFIGVNTPSFFQRKNARENQKSKHIACFFSGAL